MPTKRNKGGEMQPYIPAGNGDASGEYTNSKGSSENFKSEKKESSFGKSFEKGLKQGLGIKEEPSAKNESEGFTNNFGRLQQIFNETAGKQLSEEEEDRYFDEIEGMFGETVANEAVAVFDGRIPREAVEHRAKVLHFIDKYEKDYTPAKEKQIRAQVFNELKNTEEDASDITNNIINALYSNYNYYRK